MIKRISENPVRVILECLSAISFLIHTIGIFPAFTAVVENPQERFIQPIFVLDAHRQTPLVQTQRWEVSSMNRSMAAPKSS